MKDLFVPESFHRHLEAHPQPGTFARRAAPVIVACVLLSCSLRLWSYEGDIIRDGDYIIHAYLSNGTFTPPNGVCEVEVLVVAGGGGGGGGDNITSNVGGGGGGGGGVLHEMAYVVTGPIEVTVGNGGAGGVGTSRGAQGGNSAFGALVAIGGGGGGSTEIHVDGGTGGSGGGGGGDGPISMGGGGLQGNAGGQGVRNANGNGYGGGGGGRNSPGGDAEKNTAAGNGGNGGFYSNFSTFGEGGFFAGGGGGGRGGLGGIGGGGAGGPDNSTAGEPGIIHTGGGGGGSAGQDGAAGGSGIVLVRYLAVTAVRVTGDVFLNFGDAIAQPGDWQDKVIDQTSELHWISIVDAGEFHKITVQVNDGAVPSGMVLKVYCERAESELVLSNTAQDFVTGIANEFASISLRYTLEVTDVNVLFAQVEPLIIEYTIESQ